MLFCWERGGGGRKKHKKMNKKRPKKIEKLDIKSKTEKKL